MHLAIHAIYRYPILYCSHIPDIKIFAKELVKMMMVESHYINQWSFRQSDTGKGVQDEVMAPRPYFKYDGIKRHISHP